MTQFKEDIQQEIIQCTDSKLLEAIVNKAIQKMKSKEVNSHLIKRFIQKLDVSLVMLNASGLSKEQLKNIQIAQKILVGKIINGVDYKN